MHVHTNIYAFWEPELAGVFFLDMISLFCYSLFGEISMNN